MKRRTTRAKALAAKKTSKFVPGTSRYAEKKRKRLEAGATSDDVNREHRTGRRGVFINPDDQTDY